MTLKDKINILEYGNEAYYEKDIKEHINDFLFLLDYNFVYSGNSSYEEQENKEYFEICNKYNINPYKEYSNEELSFKVFGFN